MPGLPSAHSRRWLAHLLLLLSVAVVAFATLYPFQFEQFGRILTLPRHFDGLRFGGYSRCCTHLAVLEPLANLLLFVPAGAALAVWLRGAEGWKSHPVTAIALGAGLSLLVEVLQVFQPERSPSLTDLLMNTLGAAAGVAAVHAYRRRNAASRGGEGDAYTS